MDIDEFLDKELANLDLGAQTDIAKKIEANINLPEQYYVKLLHTLFQQKLKWDKELYEQLLRSSRQFSNILETTHRDVKRKISKVNDLINNARIALRAGDKDVPHEIYLEVQKISDSVPTLFFEDKRAIEDQVMEFYKEVRNTTHSDMVKKISALVQEVNRLVDSIDTSIKSKDMQNAIMNYNRYIELYNQIPEDFLVQTNLLSTRILEIYKNLSIYMEIANLQRYLNGERVVSSLENVQPLPKIDKQKEILEKKKELLEKEKELLMKITKLKNK